MRFEICLSPSFIFRCFFRFRFWIVVIEGPLNIHVACYLLPDNDSTWKITHSPLSSMSSNKQLWLCQYATPCWALAVWRAPDGVVLPLCNWHPPRGRETANEWTDRIITNSDDLIKPIKPSDLMENDGGDIFQIVARKGLHKQELIDKSTIHLVYGGQLQLQRPWCSNEFGMLGWQEEGQCG